MERESLKYLQNAREIVTLHRRGAEEQRKHGNKSDNRKIIGASIEIHKTEDRYLRYIL
ncbi:MAG: hypothetical protein AB1422_11470 [bacterium]